MDEYELPEMPSLDDVLRAVHDENYKSSDYRGHVENLINEIKTLSESDANYIRNALGVVSSQSNILEVSCPVGMCNVQLVGLSEINRGYFDNVICKYYYYGACEFLDNSSGDCHYV